MLNTGLVSISFRNKSCEEIIAIAKKAGLGFIEWGGDVHVPPNDTKKAKLVAGLMKDAGIFASCYGSYFRLGITPASEFRSVAETAVILGAPTVRVWAYDKQYKDCDADTISKVEADARKIFEIAKEYGIKVNFEYHRGCLTETIDGALRLFDVCPKEALAIHWQPNPEITVEENLAELKKLPTVDIVHVFAWTYENGENVRHPLYNHSITWKEYIGTAFGKNPNCVFALEFFKNDSDEQFFTDSAVLTNIIKEI